MISFGLMGFSIGIISCLIILYIRYVYKDWKEEKTLSESYRISDIVRVAQDKNRLAREKIWAELKRFEANYTNNRGLEADHWLNLDNRIYKLEKKKKKKIT